MHGFGPIPNTASGEYFTSDRGGRLVLSCMYTASDNASFPQLTLDELLQLRRHGNRSLANQELS